jgi:putative NADH-flavin reductase
MYQHLLNRTYADKAAAEKLVRASRLAWTLVYPVTFTNGPHTGTYRSGEQIELKGLARVSRADVADFLVRQLSETQYIGKTVVVAD